jgi:D-sedoheptulose 7-phosphate isomerase
MANTNIDAEAVAERILLASADALRIAAETLPPLVARAADLVTAALAAGSKVLLCGNGGSAADAQHIAAELAGRLKRDRKGLPALALTVNASVMTALSNDYGYDMVFARQVEAIGSAGDVLVAISTSGASPNIVNALREAKSRDLVTIGLMGPGGAPMEEFCDVAVRAPGSDTQRIQEAHIAIGHAICEVAELALFGD